MLKLSIIICTYKRVKKLEKCLQSILHQKIKYIEILVIDQNEGNQLKAIIKKINNPLVRYFHIKKHGLSFARNYGINLAKGKILAFTDDDCIVDKNLLKNIYLSFQKNKQIIGIFGKVFPYRSELNKGKTCPCTFSNNKKRLITKPFLHSKYIGFGNNMAFRRKIFIKIGGFKEWLGVGSIGKSAEDAEFVLRVLLKGYKVLYNPKVKVYHNRWLTKEQFRKQCLSYSCGEVACYGYFCFQGLKLGKQVVVNNFKDSYWKFRKAIKSILFLRKGAVKLLFNSLEELFYRVRGLVVGAYFSKKEPI